MRMTVSLCIILLELTNDLLMLPLMMLVLLISKTVGDCFNMGVYEQIVRMKGLPYLVGDIHGKLCSKGCCFWSIVHIFGGRKVGNMLHFLKTTSHHGGTRS